MSHNYRSTHIHIIIWFICSPNPLQEEACPSSKLFCIVKLCSPHWQVSLLRSRLTCVKSLRVFPVSFSLWPNVPCASCSSCNFIICQWPRRHLQSAALSVLHKTIENQWLPGHWHITAIRRHREGYKMSNVSSWISCGSYCLPDLQWLTSYSVS